MARPESLLDQIERDVLDESASVAGALRKCLALGGQSGSEELRDWATVELQGYKDLEVTPLPDYRVVPAPLMIDVFSANAHVKGQTISPSVLPDFVQDDVKSEVEFRGGIGELEALAAQGEREGIVRIGLPMGSEIARFMNSELQHQYSSVERIYWGVVPAAIRGVTDQVRTALTQLVAELRAATPRGEEVPSSEAVHQAIQVAVHGKRARVNETTAQASGEGTTTVQAPEPEQPDTGFWTPQEDRRVHRRRLRCCWRGVRRPRGVLDPPRQRHPDRSDLGGLRLACWDTVNSRSEHDRTHGTPCPNLERR